MFYIITYALTVLGAFGVVTVVEAATDSDKLSDFKGLSRRAPGLSLCLLIFLLSLGGIPPLAGFFAKFYVFLAAINAGLYVLAVIGVLASVVGAYYYLMIVKTMYFDDPKASFDAMPGLLRLVLLVSGVVNLLFFAWPAPIIGAASAAAKSLF